MPVRMAFDDGELSDSESEFFPDPWDTDYSSGDDTRPDSLSSEDENYDQDEEPDFKIRMRKVYSKTHT